MVERLSGKQVEKMYYWHALPERWEQLPYSSFLEKRRELIAKVIADGYEILSRGVQHEVSDDEPISLEAVIQMGESPELELKSTLRSNLHTGQLDPRMEMACLTTIAGFLNSNGGTLVIGVADDGSPVGLELDGFASEDKMNLHLVNLVRGRMGAEFLAWVHPRFEDLDGYRVMKVDCWKAQAPVYVNDGKDEKFYIRTGPSTTKLSASQTVDYIRHRFDN